MQISLKTEVIKGEKKALKQWRKELNPYINT